MDERVTVTDPTTWPPQVQARYHAGRRPRWVVPVLIAVALGLLAIVTYLGMSLSRMSISAGLGSYRVVADDHVEVSFAVQRRNEVAATCVVRARAEDGFDVGYAVVHLPAAKGTTAHAYQIRTARRAIIGELLGCAAGNEPPPVSPAQFRPGDVPPDQPWTSSAA